MEKYIKYLKYLLRHKWFVMTECFREGLVWRGLVHDLSKFLPDEFIPYARYFYGNYHSITEYHGDIRNMVISAGCSKEAISEKFDLAWLKHQKRNKHHWQWWLLQEDSGSLKVLDMDTTFIREMICDWVGAGKAQGKISPTNDRYAETRKWYLEHGKTMQLSDFTRNFVEKRILTNSVQ